MSTQSPGRGVNWLRRPPPCWPSTASRGHSTGWLTSRAPGGSTWPGCPSPPWWRPSQEALTAALATPELRPTQLGRWGDWLVVAADLTLLRSGLLVPADATAAQDAHDEAERLRQRLLGGAEIGRAADWLESRGQLGRDVFGRGRQMGQGPSGLGAPAMSPPCCGRASPRSGCPLRPVRSTGCPGRRFGAWPTRPSGSGGCCR